MAKAIAGAVFLGDGSTKIFERAIAGNSFSISAKYCSWVTMKILSVEINLFSLSRVIWNRVLSEPIFKNCLGRQVRDLGHKRVPPPPARMTAYLFSFSIVSRLFE